MEVAIKYIVAYFCLFYIVAYFGNSPSRHLDKLAVWYY
jgi:hypothetical protein